LAQRGFIVAAPHFPLADERESGTIDEGDLVNEPADLTFVISQLIGVAKTTGNPLHEAVDAGRIGVVGHSDGAEAALAVAYAPNDEDARVRAVIAESAHPLRLQPPSARLISSVPLFLVLGDRDQYVPLDQGLQVAAQIEAPGWVLVLHGADHLSAIAGPSSRSGALDRATADFLAGSLYTTNNLPVILSNDVSGMSSSLTPLQARGS
jgi:predicted dienelactone hydrolase